MASNATEIHTSLYSELVEVCSIDTLNRLAVKLLDESNFRRLQVEMAARDVIFYRADYWTEDTLARNTASIANIKNTLTLISVEDPAPRALHILQIIMATVPGASVGVRRFLKRVTFA